MSPRELSLIEEFECARARKDLARLDFYAARMFSRERREADRRYRQARRDMDRIEDALDRERAEEVLRDLDRDRDPARPDPTQAQSW